MATTTIAPPTTTTTPFPKAAVETALRDELIEAIKIEAFIKGISLPAAPGEIAKASVHVDSLVTVCVLCVIEPIVGFELPESVVRTGGYASVEAALGHLTQQIEKQWIKRKGAKP
jgi:hypothetical protein